MVPKKQIIDIRMRPRARIHRDSRDSESALANGMAALEIARELDMPEIEAECHILVSEAYNMSQDTDKAVSHAEEALAIYKQEKCLLGQTRALLALSECYMLEPDDYSKAVKYARQSVDVADALDCKLQLARARYALGYTLYHCERYTEATKTTKDGLRTAAAADAPVQEILTLDLLVQCIVATLFGEGVDPRGKHAKVYKAGCEQVMQYAKRGMTLAVRIKDKVFEGNMNYNLAFALQMLDRAQEFFKEIKNTIGCYRLADEKPGEVRAMILQAQFYLNNNDLTSAKEQYDEIKIVNRSAGDFETSQLVQKLSDDIDDFENPLTPPETGIRGLKNPALPVPKASGTRPPDRDEFKFRIEREISKLLKKPPVPITGDTNLVAVGLDSLARVELRDQLQREFGVILPSLLVYNLPTINDLADKLADVTIKQMYPKFAPQL